MNRTRLYVAGLIAPLVLPLTMIIVSRIEGVSIGEIYSAVALLFIPAAYIAAGFIGLPLLLILRACQITSVFVHLTAYGAVGVVVAITVHWIFDSERLFNPPMAGIGYIALWTATFALSALVFWLIYYGFRLRIPTSEI
jgi:hypothetical protein